jgi:hypothetical protein
MNKKTGILIIIVVLVIVVGFIIMTLQWKKNVIASIDSFEKCAQAGYPIMESYPEQCRTPDGRTFVRDISTENEATTTPITSGENAPPGSIHNLPVPEGVAVARKALAKELNIKEGTIVIMSAYEREWPNGCLGLEQEGQICTQAITPGYEVTMQAQGKTYVYRTSNAGVAIQDKNN